MEATETATKVSSDITAENHDEVNKLVETPYRLVYGVLDNPPMMVTMSLALQYIITFLAGAIGYSALLCDLVCVDMTEPLRAQIFSTTVLMAGVATLTQTAFGVRLPILQGPSLTYIPPMVVMTRLDEWKCPEKHFDPTANNASMSSTNASMVPSNSSLELKHEKLMLFSGSLIAASSFEVLIAVFGIPGYLGQYVTPVTICVTLITIGLSIAEVSLKYCVTSALVSLITATSGLTFILYLNRFTLKIPPWSKSPMKFALFRNYPFLLLLGIGWILSYILTSINYFSSDPKDLNYAARTDTKMDLITTTPWFYVPYPGQYGLPKFHIAVFLGFLMATLNSVIESIGDYYAASKLCLVSAPPHHAISRGILSEGLSGVLAGFMGVAHATTSFSPQIAMIGITKVASRVVYVWAGILLILFAILGKVAAAIATIPDPVVGGYIIVKVSVMLAMGLNTMEEAALNARNTLIIGISIAVGWLSNNWIKEYPHHINTGNLELDQILKVTLGTQIFVASTLAFIFDNTMPGTYQERGMKPSPSKTISEKDRVSDDEAYEFPMIRDFLTRNQSFFKYIPFLPQYQDTHNNETPMGKIPLDSEKQSEFSGI